MKIANVIGGIMLTAIVLFPFVVLAIQSGPRAASIMLAAFLGVVIWILVTVFFLTR